MDPALAGRLIAAARLVLQQDVESFAEALGLGVATVKRLEAGYSVRDTTLEKAIQNLRRLGVEVVESQTGGRNISLVFKPTAGKTLK